jgi:predicted esterase
LIPSGLGARTAERLKKNGYEVEYRDYEGGHEISVELVKKIYAWMARK